MSYRPPKAAADALRLHCNEGAVPPVLTPQLSRRYPDTTALRNRVAARACRPPEEVLVTAGADGAIDRIMRAFAGPGARVVVLDPTFEMIPIYAAQTGADVTRIPWGDELPEDVLLDVAKRASVIALVTPDNPTGRTISWDVVERVAQTTDGVVLLDHAYVEYADEDYTRRAAMLENVIVTRTFSKAWGLAGLRVGYAVAAPDLIEQLRGVGSPYPVSSASLELVMRCLDQPEYVGAHVVRVRRETEQLNELLADLGAEPIRSQANFVFARFADAAFVASALAAQGIAVRKFDRDGLLDALRIGCPGNAPDFERLTTALQTALRPEAMIFDMDGVLADVRESYRTAVQETCATFGVTVTAADIAESKLQPGSNDDFVVTKRLLSERGIDASLTVVTEEFQRRYDGGLWQSEALLIAQDKLEYLKTTTKLAVVTGRPRLDAERFLESNGIADLFDVVICREDAPLKPDPAPVLLALEKLGARTAQMFGDTADDILAAAGAAVLPVGITAPGEDNDTTKQNLRNAGAAAVYASITEALK